MTLTEFRSNYNKVIKSLRKTKDPKMIRTLIKQKRYLESLKNLIGISYKALAYFSRVTEIDESFYTPSRYYCSIFGCGKELTRQEYLSGNKCLEHSGPEPLIKSFYLKTVSKDEAIQALRKGKSIKHLSDPSGDYLRLSPDGKSIMFKDLFEFPFEEYWKEKSLDHNWVIL